LKRQLAIEVEKLASGAVLLRIADELAWTTFIDGKDCETIEEYDFEILRQYLELFPDEALARLIKTYLAYLGVPISDEDEEPATPSATLDDVFKVISVTELALQSSIFARRVMAEVYLHDQDFQTTSAVSEAGLELVNGHRADTGSDLILYVTSQSKSLIDDSAQCSKDIQYRIGNIARSPVPSQIPHQSPPHFGGSTF